MTLMETTTTATTAPGFTVQSLQLALSKRERDYTAAIDRVRALDVIADRDIEALRESAFLIRCMRALLEGRTVEEVYRAFGSPGDFGYESTIGVALLATYESARVAS